MTILHFRVRDGAPIQNDKSQITLKYLMYVEAHLFIIINQLLEKSLSLSHSDPIKRLPL
jgi:hypothetical protein